LSDEPAEPYFDDDGDQDDEAKLNWRAFQGLHGSAGANPLPDNAIAGGEYYE